jgi:hypothetical protein
MCPNFLTGGAVIQSVGRSDNRNVTVMARVLWKIGLDGQANRLPHRGF